MITEVEFIGGGPLDGETRRYANTPPPTVRIPVVPYDQVARVARELHEHPESVHEMPCWTYEFNGGTPRALYLYRGIERVEALA